MARSSVIDVEGDLLRFKDTHMRCQGNFSAGTVEKGFQSAQSSAFDAGDDSTSPSRILFLTD